MEHGWILVVHFNPPTIKKYVSYVRQIATMSSLSENTTYYIKIFPYTNSGANIDYKTDSPEQTTITLN